MVLQPEMIRNLCEKYKNNIDKLDRNCDFESLANECESMIQDLEFFEKLLCRANEIIKEQANATRITKTLSYFKMQTLILNKLIDQTSELMKGRIEPGSVSAILGEVVKAKTALQELFNGFKELDEIKKDLAAIEAVGSQNQLLAFTSSWENYRSTGLPILPENIQNKIGKRCSNNALLNFALTSKGHLTLFKSTLDVRKLLLHVVRGEHKAVKAVLEQNIGLIYEKNRVTDCSGRTFDNISPFEYTLWALDKHMWSLMLECIPNNKKGNEVLQILSEQYNNIRVKGVTYTFYNKQITETHFDFKNTIIQELQRQVGSSNKVDDWSSNEFYTQFRKGIGGAQKLLPMHVVYEYCSRTPFAPVPKFTTQPESSKLLYVSHRREYRNWFDCYSLFDDSFAILKGSAGRAQSSESREGISTNMVRDDLMAVKALSELRTKDFQYLKSQLEEQMTLDNHHQVFQI